MSLRLRAVFITGVALLVLWTLAAAWMIRGVQGNLDHALDERLAMSARMVSGLLQRSALSVSSATHLHDAQQAVQVGGGRGIACQIRSLRGEILAQTDGAPDAAFRPPLSGYNIIEVDGETWRTYTFSDGDYQIITADRIEERAGLTRQMLMATTFPFLIAVAGGLVALWIGIGRGLFPLEVLRRALQERRALDTRPVDIGSPPNELKPVVGALNDLLVRLTSLLDSQRAFTDAAAHELRTPLTVIDTHLQVAQMTDGETAADSLEKAGEGVRRLSRIVDQMMILARAEAHSADDETDHPITAVISELVDGFTAAEQKRVKLELDRGANLRAAMPRSLLEAAVRNLVDNALRYSPAHEPVIIQVSCVIEPWRGVIQVVDQGPGLSSDHIAQVGRRFWRGDQGRSSGDGAGLGLSIVHSIMDRFGGALILRRRSKGAGLVAELSVPLRR